MRGESFVWTDLEEDILIQAVKEARNVKNGLHNASEVLGTTFFICRNRWYKHTQQRMLEQDMAAAGEKPVVIEAEVVQEDSTIKGMKDSLEDFLGHLTTIVAKNRKLTQENGELVRENRLLVQENKELRESYDYILKVIDRARRLTLEDDERPDKIKYTIKDGAVERTA